MNFKRSGLASCLGLLVAAGSCVAQMYTVTDLGTLGGSESFASAVNESGDVVGYSWLPGDLSGHWFLHSNGTMQDLSSFGASSSTGVINNTRQIAGGIFVNAVSVPAIVDRATDTPHLISPFGGNPSGFGGAALAMNSAGNAVGYLYIKGARRHAFLYRNGVMTDINPFGGYSWAEGINDDGDIVGSASEKYNGVAHAFVRSNGVTKKIGPDTESYARHINDHGQAVGEFLTADHADFHPFVDSGGTFSDLGFPGGATSIDNYGQVVGWSPHSPAGHAFLYSNGVMHDLNKLIPARSKCALLFPEPVDINDRGQISASRNCSGQWHAVRLDPIYRAFVQQPIQGDGSSVFKARNGVVPVKFTLTRHDVQTCTLPRATMSITRVARGTMASAEEHIYSRSSHRGSCFRNDGCRYTCDLAALSLGKGAYRVDISIKGIMVGHASFSLE
jgi:probable HAF family extracellular repeat protein